MVMTSDQTIWASVFVRESNHEQDGRRLLTQSLVAHFHEARHRAGFLFWQHSRPVATERYGEVCEVWLLDIECFQKGRAIKAGYVYPASFDRLPEVAG